MTTDIKPIHPGEVLFEVYMKPAIPPLTIEMLSETLGLDEQLLADLIKGGRSITPLLAGQLSVVCRTTPEYWLQLQKMYDRQIANSMVARQRHAIHRAAAA
jgi:antitoxin HigA-1